MASYPDPSAGDVPSISASQPTTPHQQQQPTPQQQDYDSLPSPVSVPATTVAHHGLQVLQATTGAPSTPGPDANELAQQYAQSATMQMGDHQFAPPPSIDTSITATPGSQKVTRLRRACDMCSQRKVKCDESGPPCKPCSDLQVECTFNRTMKRRGPPNKHAEAARLAKRPRNEDVSPPPHHAAETLVSIAAHNGQAVAGIDAETIAPWPILELLVDDFFTYIHPLMPFPHEPTFRAALTSRMDRSSGEFLALVASMVGVLVASFPRSARSHLKAQDSTGLFSSAVDMIDHCRAIALEARGAQFMVKDDMSVDVAATSYFLGLAAAHTLQWRLCKRFLTETMTFCRELLGTYQQSGLSTVAQRIPGLTQMFNASANGPIDHIKDQISKRIFWVMVAGIRSMTQLGVSINEIPLPPPTSQEPYPEQPIEVDDQYIYSTQILAQPEDVASLIVGFNRNIRVYMTMNELVGVDMCYGINFFDWTAQKNILSNGLAAAKQAADDLPPELQVKTDNLQHLENHTMGFDDSDLEYYPPALPITQPANDLRRIFAEQPLRRRHLQFEIQKANIQLSQLATRSYFVERYLNLRDIRRADPNFAERAKTEEKDDRDSMMENEREVIVQNLVTVLASISQRNMEPNGCSLINKIRQVASTLVEDSNSAEHKEQVATKAKGYLNGFLDILMKLEKIGAAPRAETMTPQDEEEELRNWTSLKEYQLRFLSTGGFMGDGY
ncbi:uncharacterized protein GGS22DRAFT_158207 [Annulohypoxylon maeteangense]|uniref:uncharacterized protein n=1 Tax=Annulohypoxylon maeteangense TaxID=1927788 RepID=UPI002008E8DC|nr:uncharacterized protein GGS22DRAFT_158207 [Annulohypoxylon maeteangense]KAI0886594.1 hypothetical protein GGS22DRAFT_158207 [Annulohypoxylon maeteangense]